MIVQLKVHVEVDQKRWTDAVTKLYKPGVLSNMDAMGVIFDLVQWSRFVY